MRYSGTTVPVAISFAFGPEVDMLDSTSHPLRRLAVQPTTRLRFSAMVLVAVSLCSGCRPVVALVVDPQLAAPTQSARQQFAADLRAAGYKVRVTESALTDPVQVRKYLQNVFKSSRGRLRGAILIGNIPRAYQYVSLHPSNPAIPSLDEEVISYQFYADLDGEFGRSAAYQSPTGKTYSYDLHSGNVDWEIWVGVLPMLNDDYGQTVEAVNRYFERNHTYRTEGSDLPRAFLEVNEHRTATTDSEHQAILADLMTGQYAWTPWSTAPSTQIFFNSSSASMTVADGYVAVAGGTADFFAGAAHGYWGGHGQLTMAWLATNPVRTTFFWSDGCAVANLDHAPNFLTSVLYDADGSVLAAKGTTNNSGGLGTNQNGFFGHNIATRMSLGNSLGDALVHHVNVPLLPPWSSSREFHYATVVVLGDPTLTLPE